MASILTNLSSSDLAISERISSFSIFFTASRREEESDDSVAIVFKAFSSLNLLIALSLTSSFSSLKAISLNNSSSSILSSDSLLIYLS